MVRQITQRGIPGDGWQQGAITALRQQVFHDGRGFPEHQTIIINGRDFALGMDLQVSRILLASVKRVKDSS